MAYGYSYCGFLHKVLGLTTITSDNEETNFPIENASDYPERPGFTFRTTDKTETTIAINPDGDYGAVALLNCNFPAINMDIDALPINDDLTAIHDKGTGKYHFFWWNFGADTGNNFDLTIAASQTTYDGASYYEVGSILVGEKINFGMTSYPPLPQLPIKKKVVESTKEIQCDSGYKDIYHVGRNYHLLEYVWQAASRTELEQIQELMHLAAPGALCVMYEDWEGAGGEDYEAVYLCAPFEKFTHKVRQGHNKITLKLREIV